MSRIPHRIRCAEAVFHRLTNLLDPVYTDKDGEDVLVLCRSILPPAQTRLWNNACEVLSNYLSGEFEQPPAQRERAAQPAAPQSPPPQSPIFFAGRVFEEPA